jgi:hypothetical protein
MRRKFGRGTACVAISKRDGIAACNTSRVALNSRSRGMLPIPLPINIIADARSAAPGSEMVAPPTEPICTKRIG